MGQSSGKWHERLLATFVSFRGFGGQSAFCQLKSIDSTSDVLKVFAKHVLSFSKNEFDLSKLDSKEHSEEQSMRLPE